MPPAPSRPPASTSCGGRAAAGSCCTARASSGRSPWSCRPACCPTARTRAYRMVRDAMADGPGRGRRARSTRPATSPTRVRRCASRRRLRHDLLVAGAKAVAVAQVRRGDRHLVHGSVLERRPPAALRRGGRGGDRRALARRRPRRRRRSRPTALRCGAAFVARLERRRSARAARQRHGTTATTEEETLR